jgi:hypothetical protein
VVVASTFNQAVQALEGTSMKWMGAYLFGYIIVLAGIIAALWKSGLLSRVSPTWIAICVVIAVGIGIMVAVANSGRKESIQIDENRR